MLIRGRNFGYGDRVGQEGAGSHLRAYRAARVQCGVERGLDGWLKHLTSPSGAWPKNLRNWAGEGVVNHDSLSSWAFILTVTPGTQTPTGRGTQTLLPGCPES